MFRRNNLSIIQVSHLYFRMSEIAGRWHSREGSPEILIYHNDKRRGGGYYITFAYSPDTVLQRPVKEYWGLRYFDLWGRIGLAYDPGQDMLILSDYGNYYRTEE